MREPPDGTIARLLLENDRLRVENAYLRAMAPLDVHAQEDEGTTTVVARIKALGVRGGRKFAWRVGSVVRAAWEKQHGSLPVKANTAKVSGHGSHCHARYPLSWVPRIDAIVAFHAGTEGPQGCLTLPLAPRPAASTEGAAS